MLKVKPAMVITPDLCEMFTVTDERARSVLERAESFLEKIEKQIHLTPT